MCSLAVAEDIHSVLTPAPHAWKRDQFRAAPRTQRGCCKMCQGIPKLHQNHGRGDRGEQTETGAQGWSNPVGQDGTLGPTAQATSNFQFRVREEIRKHPALQLERRKRRKCTWCFEFRKLQISILLGIALINLLSAEGQRDIVHDHHHPLQGHRPLRTCLMPALYPHHHGARAQAPAKQLHTHLEHVAGQQ